MTYVYLSFICHIYLSQFVFTLFCFVDNCIVFEQWPPFYVDCPQTFIYTFVEYLTDIQASSSDSLFCLMRYEEDTEDKYG